MNNLTPLYTKDPFPPLHQSQYSVRRQEAVGRIVARTENSNPVFILIASLSGTNSIQKLGHRRQLQFLRKSPIQNSSSCKTYFGIYDPHGSSDLSQFRVCRSKLNFHKFKHNFKDTVNPMCPVNDGIEVTEHCLLLCSSFDVQRRDLLAEVSQFLQPFIQINNLSNVGLTELLLYGDKYLSDSINQSIPQFTITFIPTTCRFG